MSGPVEFIGDNAIDWKHARTFQDSVIAIRSTKGIHSAEYRALESFHGKQRLDQIWSEHLAKEALSELGES